MLLCACIAGEVQCQVNDDWVVHSFPSLSNKTALRDMSFDEKGFMWFLNESETYFIREGALTAYDPDYAAVLGAQLKYLKDPKDSSLFVLCERGIIDLKNHEDGLMSFELAADEVIADGKMLNEGRIALLISGPNANRTTIYNWKKSVELVTLKVKENQTHLFSSGENVFVFGDSSFNYSLKHPEATSWTDCPKIDSVIAERGELLLIKAKDNNYYKIDLSKKSFEILPFSEHPDAAWFEPSGSVVRLRKNMVFRVHGNSDSLATSGELSGELLESFFKYGFVCASDVKGQVWLMSSSSILCLNPVVPEAEWRAAKFYPGTIRQVLKDEERDLTLFLQKQGEAFYVTNYDETELKWAEVGPAARGVGGFRMIDYSNFVYIYSSSGIFEFSKDDFSIKKIIKPPTTEQQTNVRFNHLELDRKNGILYAGTKKDLVVEFDLATRQDTVYKVAIESGNPYNYGTGLIYEIDCFENGNPVVLAQHGLYTKSVESMSWQAFPAVYPEFSGRLKWASGIKLIKDSLLAVSTFRSGFYIFNLGTGETRNSEGAFSTADISDFEWDGGDHLVGMTTKGVLVRRLSDGAEILLTKENGMLYDYHYYKYLRRQEKGLLFIGSSDGYWALHTDSLDFQHSEKLYISSALVNGQRELVKGNILTKKYIELNHKDNLFISLINQDQINAEVNGFQYKLEPLDSVWKPLGADKTAKYLALSPSSYALKVRQNNGEGETSILKVKVLQPFYLQWWFLLLLFLTGLLIFWIFRRIKIKAKKKEERLKFEYESKVAMLELKTLRAQMNPHFMFNSMNSIKSFIAQNEPRTATRYLTKFSHLMRLILNNSNLAKVNLEDELKALELYIELEQMRYEGGFEYEIQIDDNVHAANIDLPSMIVQPYVENAIWHGLLHKEGERKLTIELKIEAKYLTIRVADNGIGREAAKALKSKSATKHKSMGMAITASRIALTNAQEMNGVDQVSISDLVGPKGAAIGTEVFIKILIKGD